MAGTVDGISQGAPSATQPSSLCFQSAKSLAGLIRKKKLSAREVLEAHLKQIERVNPKVNAIITLVSEQAMETAKQCDESAARGRFLGPLHGLPVAHKDLHDTKGIRTTYGSPIFKDHVPNADTLIVHRIREAGAVTLGKTNAPIRRRIADVQSLIWSDEKSLRSLQDMWRFKRGAAVALACGMVPIADGSDTGGSLRNPASFSSVVGFRTSPGRVPRVPTNSAWSTINIAGPMARTVADCGLLLSAIAGPDERAPLSIHENGVRYAKPLGRDFKDVRVAWFKDLGGLPFDRRIREVMDARRKVFESLGCIVEQAEPDFTGADESFPRCSRTELLSAARGDCGRAPGANQGNRVRGSRSRRPADGSSNRESGNATLSLVSAGRGVLRQIRVFCSARDASPPFDIDQQYVAKSKARKWATN